MKNKIVISLYDFTGEALKPWAEAGYACYAFDIQHLDTKVEGYANGGCVMVKTNQNPTIT